MPIPMVTPNIGTSVNMGAPIPTPSSGSLNIEMKCNIEFRLMMILWNLFTRSARRVNGCVILSRLHTVYLKLLETYSNERSDIQY